MTTRMHPRTMNGVNGAFKDATYASACNGLQQALLANINPHGAPRPMTCISEFVSIYRAYRRFHGRAYSARIAWGCVFRGLPF